MLPTTLILRGVVTKWPVQTPLGDALDLFYIVASCMLDILTMIPIPKLDLLRRHHQHHLLFLGRRRQTDFFQTSSFRPGGSKSLSDSYQTEVLSHRVP